MVLNLTMLIELCLVAQALKAQHIVGKPSCNESSIMTLWMNGLRRNDDAMIANSWCQKIARNNIVPQGAIKEEEHDKTTAAMVHIAAVVNKI